MHIAREILFSTIVTTLILTFLFLAGIIAIEPATGSRDINRQVPDRPNVLERFDELPVAPPEVVERWETGVRLSDWPARVKMRLCAQDEQPIWTIEGAPEYSAIEYYDDSGTRLGTRHSFDDRPTRTEGAPPRDFGPDECVLVTPRD